MKSRWHDDEARAFCDRFAACGETLALRIYSAQLIGADPDLVLHGGGNCSAKTTLRDLLGREIDVMHVKGSGVELREVEPEGVPAVRLAPLRELRALDRLSDEDMVSTVRAALLDASAPTPSVEVLLHAFLPYRFVDHVHADAILALTNQPEREDYLRDALGDDVAVLPWITPGFPLAKAVAAALAAMPGCRGVVLRKHGLLTFGDDARESYERTVELVERAEHYIARKVGGVPAMLCGEPAPLPAAKRERVLAAAMPVLRGAVATREETALGPRWRRVVAVARSGDDVASFCAHSAARGLCTRGPVAPDHVLRTKGRFMYLSSEEALRSDTCNREVANFVAAYQRYYDDHCRRFGVAMLAPQPVVALIEGVGLFACGDSPAAARAAADIAEHTVRVKARAHALGSYEPLTPAELAEVEYRPLERRKLRAEPRAALAGQIALVTAAAGDPGAGIVEALLDHDACVYAVDPSAERLAALAARFAGRSDRLATRAGDLRDAAAVDALVDACSRHFGGIDCLVTNAEASCVGSLEELDAERFRDALEAGAVATLRVLQRVVAVLRAQGTGGSVVLQVSGDLRAPEQACGACSAGRAATLQLLRVAADEFAAFGVRCNAVESVTSAGAPLPRAVGEAVALLAADTCPASGAVLPVRGSPREAASR